MKNILALAGLGGKEIAIIAIACVVLFGSKKIPELAKGLAQSIKEFKKAAKDDSEEKTK